MIMSQDVSNGNHNNLPFSIDNILREDFGPQKEHVNSYPSGSYIGIPRFYYRYNPWTFARWNFLGRVVPLHTGAAALHQRPIDLETSEQQEKVINVDCTKDCRSDSECSDSDESGKNQATAINQGKRQHEDTADTPEEPKKKRAKSQFTEMQLKYLENYFSDNSYLSRDERTVLAQALDMTELQIRNWFQNKRYQKKHKVTTSTSTATATSSKEEEEGDAAPSSKS